MESIRVCDVVDKHDEIGFAQKFESDFFKDVLSGDIDTMQFYFFILVFLIKLDVFDVVFTALGHHILMVKCIINSLVN